MNKEQGKVRQKRGRPLINELTSNHEVKRVRGGKDSELVWKNWTGA
jgi:hypothetical protein